MGCSLHVYNSSLESTMETEKKKGNLDCLLNLLGDKKYENIIAAYPDLVKPVDEFAESRGFKTTSKIETNSVE